MKKFYLKLYFGTIDMVKINNLKFYKHIILLWVMVSAFCFQRANIYVSLGFFMESQFKQFAEYCMKGGLTAEEFAIFEPELRYKIVKKGEILLKPGLNSSEVFYVNKGLLRAFVLDDQAKEHIVQFTLEGWLITDRNHIDNLPTVFYIDAIEDSEVVIFQEDLLIRMARISTVFGEFHKKMLHKRIRIMQTRIIKLLSKKADQKYKIFMENYPQLVQRLPQWMIASYLGITPESLSRVRKELASKPGGANG